MSYSMLAKQEDQALTTPEQAAGQYVADLSQIPADKQEASTDSSSVSMPTSNVALDLQQDYQAQFSAAQAQAVAQVAAAMSQANNGAYPVEFTGAVPGNPDVQSHVTAVQQPNSNELYRKTLISDKVRAENRERKKRWREQNEDRNKDNDLRCRVNKRANRLFGAADSEHKRSWIEREFVKRQAKRKEKELRKTSIGGSPNNTGSLGNDHMQNAGQSSDLSQLQNTPYYSMGNNMAPLSPNTAAKLLNNNLAEAMKAQQESNQLTSAQLLEKLLQQAPTPQLEGSQLQQFNGQSGEENSNSAQLTDVTSAVSQTSTTPATAPQTSAAPNGGAAAGQNGDYPMEAVLTLMQLNAGWRQ
ncbi:hypothetical protein VKS41_003353 [Umbelopsis sp. WA50703]